MLYDKSEHIVVERIEFNGKRDIPKGKFYCILNGKTYDSAFGLNNAIKPHITMKQYYIEYYATEEDLLPCSICGVGDRIFKDILVGFRDFCSRSCANKREDKRDKISKRFLNNPEKLESFREKKRLTDSKKTEIDKKNSSEKRQNTVIEKYGSDYLSKRTKRQWENKTEEEIKASVDKANETKKKNGTMVHPDFLKSNRRIIISDKEYFCQGYEDAVLKFLILDYGFHPSDVLVGKEVPRISFGGNKSGIYKPDIYIKSLNLIIEVKSDYTMTNELNNNYINKQLSTIKQGHFYVYVVLKNLKSKNDREMIDIDKNVLGDFLDMTISSQARLIEITEKVQRLSCGGEYRAIAIGSGSAKVPTIWNVI